MDQNLVNWLAAAAGAVISFLLSRLWEAVKDLQEADKALANKVASIEVLVAGNYVTKHDLSKALDRVSQQLDRIEHKLEAKADK